MPQVNVPSLYGIDSKNSSRMGDNLWGKNQFNSTFPLALCLYMRDIGIAPVTVDARNGEVRARNDTPWQMEDIFGHKDENFYYDFESSFETYDKMIRITDQNEKKKKGDRIDLVVREEDKGQELHALEVKLTVVPDSGTAKRNENEWAPELVIRPVTSAYAMMSFAAALKGSLKSDVKKILSKAYDPINSWDNTTEIIKQADKIRQSLDNALIHAEEIQCPFLLQPIWRTKGQTLDLAENCFDVFVWSNIAVLRIPIIEHDDEGADKAKRSLREIARHVRALYDILTTGNYSYDGIYKGMALGKQTDKAFAVSGLRTYKYLNHQRLNKPILRKEILEKVILYGGEHELKPERRFDSAVLNYHAKNQN